MLTGPDWIKLYDKGLCLDYGVPFTDEQQSQLDGASNTIQREALVREFREVYRGSLPTKEDLKKEAEEVAKLKEEQEENVKAAKRPNGKKWK